MMKRISNEDGVNAGQRNIGRFFLAAIPWLLGLGASVWLGVWIGYHDFRHQLSQEDRAAIYVGAENRPKAKIIPTIMPKDCTHITRADIDGSTLLLWARNDCDSYLSYMS